MRGENRPVPKGLRLKRPPAALLRLPVAVTTVLRGAPCIRTFQSATRPTLGRTRGSWVKGGAYENLTTQLYIKDHPQNSEDWIFQRVGAPELVQAEFVPASGGSAELEAKWDIQLGVKNMADEV